MGKEVKYMVMQVGMMPGVAGYGLVLAVVGILIGALVLWLSAAKIFKLKDKTFTTPFIIVVIASLAWIILNVVPFINFFGWILAILLTIWLIRTRYKVDWGKAALVWAVYFVLFLVIMGVIGLFFFGTMIGMMGMM